MSAREKLAITPLFLARREFASSREYPPESVEHNPDDPRMCDEVGVQVVLGGQGELEHDVLPVRHSLSCPAIASLSNCSASGFLRALDVDLGFDDRNQT